MEKVIHKLGRSTVSLSRAIVQVDGDESRVFGVSHTREECGERSADLVVEIDLDRLLRAMRSRAMLSKARRATLQGGAVIVKVVKGTERDTVNEHVHKPRCYYGGKVVCGQAKDGEASGPAPKTGDQNRGVA